jgi:gluconokinase
VTQGLVILVMGVSGSGKTTIGRLLAERLSFQFIDGDDLHPDANKRKMGQGIPLTESDRKPWLDLIAERISGWLAEGERVVLACSALTESHRRVLIKNHDRVPIIFLSGSFDLIEKRLAMRKGHFFDSRLLSSQFTTLEAPKHAIKLDISANPEELTEQACICLKPYLNQ